MKVDRELFKRLSGRELSDALREDEKHLGEQAIAARQATEKAAMELEKIVRESKAKREKDKAERKQPVGKRGKHKK